MNVQTRDAVIAIDQLLETIDPDMELQHVDCSGAVFSGLACTQELCHALAAHSGWWTNLQTGQPKTIEEVNVAEKLMLIVSEIAEAMEGDRKNLMDDKLPHRKMLEVELADALIRIFDLAGFLKLDLAGATLEKLAFNQSREDHQRANRMAPGGKAY